MEIHQGVCLSISLGPGGRTVTGKFLEYKRIELAWTHCLTCERLSSESHKHNRYTKGTGA